MSIRRRTLALSLLAGFVLLCGCLAVYLFSSRSETIEPAMAPAEPEATAPLSTSVAPTAAMTAQPAIPERRRLTLEFPSRIRAGDSDLVRLTLEVDELGNLTPTAEFGGNVVSGEVVEIPNLYESHHVIAEARLDLAGMEVRPSELVSEALTPGSSVTFRWSVRPAEVGVYRGTAWLYLRFVDKESGEEARRPVSAQVVEIEAANVLGLSGDLARTGGVIGSVVGTVIGFPFFEDLIRFFLRRRNRAK